MQKYDVTLKLLLQGAAKRTMLELAGAPVEKWLNVELPKVQNPRADLLGETADGGLIHIELQSGNEPAMPLRMAEYCLGVYRLFGKLPRQAVLYVGEAPLTMESELRGANLQFHYRLLDIRDLDGDLLLDSPETGDNVIAILARLRDHKAAVQKIVGRIQELPPDERSTAISQLLLLAGLRRLAKTVVQEVKRMPVYIDILENEVLGPPFKRGLEQGMEQGLERGLEQGMEQGELRGELKVIRLQIEKRFGRIPKWAEERLSACSTTELDDLIVRVLDSPTLEDLLP